MLGLNPFAGIIGINEVLFRQIDSTQANSFDFLQILRPDGINLQWNSTFIVLDQVDHSLMALAYASMVILLFYSLYQRLDLPLRPVLQLFLIWMILGGMMNIIQIWNMSKDAGWLLSGIQGICAGMALYTVFTFSSALFPILRLKTETQAGLPKIIESQQIKLTDDSFLTDSPNLMEILKRLEILVDERTLELEKINQTLQQEITQRITAQTELDRFFQVCVDMLCIAGIDGYYKRVNPAVQSILGYSEAEFMAQPSLNLIHPDDQAATLNITIEQMEQNKPILSFQNRYRCKDGSYKWLSWTSVPVPAQRVMYSIARDITQTKQAEAEIQHLNATLEQRVQERTTQLEILNQQLVHEINERQHKEAMLRQMAQLQQAILNSANYTIIATDPTGTIQLFNRTAEQLLGYSAEEVVGKVTPAIIHDPDEIRHRTEILSQELAVEIEPGFETFVVKARTGVADENEWSYIRQDGSRFPVQLSVTALFDADGVVTGFLGIGSDITRRKAAERKLLQLTEELKRSNQELEQFAYVASHDLQEPLRAVNSYAQLIQRRYQGQFDEKADKWFEYMTNGATRMQQLINDLLSYSRVGRRGSRFTSADCNVILCKALDNLHVTIDEKQAVVESESLPVVIGDAGQLVQLFQNLIGNGIKFCRDAIPQIYIGVQKQETEWVFQIKDNGIGIGDEYRERIFEIFQRLHSRREYAGTGIGLAICKRIVERHQGRIWVESHLNAGSTFYFTISASLKDELT